MTAKSAIDLPEGTGIQDVFRHLANDSERTNSIADAVQGAFDQGRKILVLTERTEHLEAVASALFGKVPSFCILHGRMSKKQRAKSIKELDDLAPTAARVLLATGKLVGEGFDHPPLDTLVLAMPISWKGTAAIRWSVASRARHQDQRANRRLCRHGPPHSAANVGQASTRISCHGLSDRRAMTDVQTMEFF